MALSLFPMNITDSESKKWPAYERVVLMEHLFVLDTFKSGFRICFDCDILIEW